ncbi:hypothetical protein PENTCL1PPCAC_9978 [Pristionchus entomophagus]|uniref:Uncharacterized protein n=1 Tax=Pristionchus entomophagus TaxID=358040 RepID=A0AAV5T0P6_9BILA|nr:hypothetical protein PENTCL1PPCAC_9978 [Pristionchus entomophagus]
MYNISAIFLEMDELRSLDFRLWIIRVKDDWSWRGSHPSVMLLPERNVDCTSQVLSHPLHIRLDHTAHLGPKCPPVLVYSRLRNCSFQHDIVFILGYSMVIRNARGVVGVTVVSEGRFTTPSISVSNIPRR